MTRFLTVLSRLPLFVLYFLADLLAIPASRFYRRQIVVENIRKCFPHYSERDVNKLANAFYHRLASFFAETIKALTISEKALKKRVKYLNPEIIYDSEGNPEPILFFASHQINWEWLGLASNLYFPYPSEAVYRPLRSKSTEQFMNSMRTRFGTKLIDKSVAIPYFRERGNVPRAIGIIADQVPRERREKLWASFMGMETAFLRGIRDIPHATQAKAVFAQLRSVRRGYYEVKYVEIGRPPYGEEDLSVLRGYIRECEVQLREAPESWLWTHKRWKYQRKENEEMLIL